MFLAPWRTWRVTSNTFINHGVLLVFCFFFWIHFELLWTYFFYVRQAFQMLLSLELLKAVFLTDFVFSVTLFMSIQVYSWHWQLLLSLKNPNFFTNRNNNNNSNKIIFVLIPFSFYMLSSPQVDRKPEKFCTVSHYWIHGALNFFQFWMRTFSFEGLHDKWLVKGQKPKRGS